MKIEIDPMIALRAARIEAVNANFSVLAAGQLHVELVAALLHGDTQALAEREARRQKILAAIAAAKTPDELDRVHEVLET
jgi:hypothetical protein